MPAHVHAQRLCGPRHPHACRRSLTSDRAVALAGGPRGGWGSAGGAAPIAPMPIMPSVLPESCMPSGSPSPRFAKVTSCSGTRRASMSSIIIAASATEAALMPGPAGRSGQSAAKRGPCVLPHTGGTAPVLVAIVWQSQGSQMPGAGGPVNTPGLVHTGMPRACAASTAMLLYPAAGCTISFRLRAALTTSAPHTAVVGTRTSALATCGRDTGGVCAQLWRSNRLRTCVWKQH